MSKDTIYTIALLVALIIISDDIEIEKKSDSVEKV